jgi:trimethylamine:corrinoid methyltransferase-like protein
MMQVFYSRPGICPYLGSVDEGITFSLHCLLYGDELAGMLRSLWRGIEVSDEMLALELTRAAAPRGDYLAQEHTAKYCRREAWNARYFGGKFPTASGGLPDEDLVERIDKELQQILENYRPPTLPREVLDEMDAIRESFRQNYRPAS